MARLRFLEILEIFFDFLRGCFDGDGSMYAYWDPRWRSSYMFYVCFASASPRFLEWIQVTVEHLSGVRGKIGTTGSGRVQQLRFAKKGQEFFGEKCTIPTPPLT